MQENVAPEKHKGSPDYFPEFALLFVVISDWNISLKTCPLKGHLHQFFPLLLCSLLGCCLDSDINANVCVH